MCWSLDSHPRLAGSGASKAAPLWLREAEDEREPEEKVRLKGLKRQEWTAREKEREALLCLHLHSSLPSGLTCSSSTLALTITERSFVPLVLHSTLTTCTLLPAMEPEVSQRYCIV